MRMKRGAAMNREAGTVATAVQPSGVCDCGRRAYKKFHGRDWVCARCARIEIEWNKRRRKTAEVRQN